MNIDFLIEWSTAVKDFVGFPRPYAKYGIDKESNPLNLAPKTPIPWQSIPNKIGDGIRLLQRHEDSVYTDNVCAYCGVAFSPNEETIRWTTIDKPLTKSGPRVFSDVHPFHLECMEQARAFCPHMKKTIDDEFETGTYSKLRSNADEQIRPYLI